MGETHINLRKLMARQDDAKDRGNYGLDRDSNLLREFRRIGRHLGSTVGPLWGRGSTALLQPELVEARVANTNLEIKEAFIKITGEQTT